jgi:hypothetical protein
MFKCLTARYMFDRLRSYNPYGIIITSGTLIPDDVWHKEKEFKDPNRNVIFFPNGPIIK